MKGHWISMGEVARHLHVSRPTACARLESGQIPGLVENLGTRRIERSVFMAWLSKQVVPEKRINQKSVVKLRRAAFLVYFIECEHGERPVKIGCTTTSNLKTRLAKLKTASPHPLRLLGTVVGGREAERKLHRRFKADRLRGEWFRHSENLRKYLKAQGL